MKIVCPGWSGSPHPDGPLVIRILPGDDEKISHGICPDCEDKMDSEERAAETASRFTTDTQGYKLRTMRIDDERWNGAKIRSRQEGMSLSAWLRGLIDRALTKKKR